MFIKGIIIAGAAGLMSTGAFAQDVTDRAIESQQTSAQSPTTVNPALATPAERYGASPSAADRASGLTTEIPLNPHENLPAPTGARSDVSAVSTDAALATGGSVEVTASPPVPDTAENRAKYGAPMSATGKNTPARGN